MPAEFREQVCLRFFRREHGDYRESGLGRSIVREMVAGQGSEISLRPGGPDLSMAVRLPLVEAPDGGPA